MDLVVPPSFPPHCDFFQADVLEVKTAGQYFYIGGVQLAQWAPDFICASSPCEQFSVHGMKHFHPKPPYPELGIKLFNHTRDICEASGVPYVMENVRAAQQFVGNAVHHCGPFYLWGSGVTPLIPTGIIKGLTRKAMGLREYKGQAGWNTKNSIVGRQYYRMTGFDGYQYASNSQNRKEARSVIATIPPELANSVADYAERLIEQRRLANA